MMGRASTESEGVVCAAEKGIMGQDGMERPESLNNVLRSLIV